MSHDHVWARATPLAALPDLPLTRPLGEPRDERTPAIAIH